MNISKKEIMEKIKNFLDSRAQQYDSFHIEIKLERGLGNQEIEEKMFYGKIEEETRR